MLTNDISSHCWIRDKMKVSSQPKYTWCSIQKTASWYFFFWNYSIMFYLLINLYRTFFFIITSIKSVGWFQNIRENAADYFYMCTVQSLCQKPRKNETCSLARACHEPLNRVFTWLCADVHIWNSCPQITPRTAGVFS